MNFHLIYKKTCLFSSGVLDLEQIFFGSQSKKEKEKWVHTFENEFFSPFICNFLEFIFRKWGINTFLDIKRIVYAWKILAKKNLKIFQGKVFRKFRYIDERKNGVFIALKIAVGLKRMAKVRERSLIKFISWTSLLQRFRDPSLPLKFREHLFILITARQSEYLAAGREFIIFRMEIWILGIWSLFFLL